MLCALELLALPEFLMPVELRNRVCAEEVLVEAPRSPIDLRVALVDVLVKDKPYDPTLGTLMLAAAVIILSAVFFGVSCGLFGIHNKRVKKLAPETQDETAAK